MKHIKTKILDFTRFYVLNPNKPPFAMRGYCVYDVSFECRSEVWRCSLVYVVNEQLVTRVIFTVLLGIAALELIVSF